MRLQGLATTTALCALLAGSVLVACNKSDDDKDDDGGGAEVSAENKADATKASAASVSALSNLGSNGGSLLDSETRQRIRQAYRQSQASMAMMQGDDTDPGTDPGNFELNCGTMYGTQMCEAMAEAPPTLGEGGPACTATCPETGNGLNFACTIESYDLKCGADTFKMSQGTMSMAMTCADNEDGSMTISNTANTDVSISGGTITEPVELKCSMKFDMKLDFSGTGEPGAEEGDEMDMDKMCESFSCTIGGTPITCEDMKTAMAENSCDEPAAAE